jgi:hypothetical protein
MLYSSCNQVVMLFAEGELGMGTGRAHGHEQG